MSTDKVDAREAYLAEAKRLLSRAMFAVTKCDADAMKLAGDAVMEHFRTTPEGYRMVPVEPTDDMCEAAWESDGTDYVGEHLRIWQIAPAYRAMLAAAQEGK